MKALALLSGGLDSTIAIKLILDQGIEVEALNFISPFCLCNQKGKCYAAEVARKFNIPLKTLAKGEEYLEMMRHPKYGYGSGMNPCIDCRIFILKKAKEYAEQIGAKFIFTGEVLDQRPKSQYRKALEIVEKEAGLEGKLLRPLSAKLLPMTEAEKKGWVDRERLLDIRGKSRKKQMELAEEYGVNDYPSPGGGCLLTRKEYAFKLRELLRHQEKMTLKDVVLLKIGRHFWHNDGHIIVGRNKTENEQLLRLKNEDDYAFEVVDYPGPITILQGPKDEDTIEFAARLTARYSDATVDRVVVECRKNGKGQRIVVEPLPAETSKVLYAQEAVK